MQRWEFDIMFRRKVRHAIEKHIETGEPMDMTPTPSEKRIASELFARGALHPVDMERIIREETLGGTAHACQLVEASQW